MTIRKIAEIGHPVLRVPARELSAAEIQSAELQTLIDDLVETMRDANGAGLAAPQIYQSLQLCALEVSDNPRYPYKPNIPLTILVNPRLRAVGPETFDNYEGCLSVPNLRGRVRRAARVQVSALDRYGKPLEIEAAGITAGTYQHEIDHLNATLFVDRVTDPNTFSTWTEFDRHHRDACVEAAYEVVKKYGS